jgi:hypothetical protein
VAAFTILGAGCRDDDCAGGVEPDLVVQAGRGSSEVNGEKGVLRTAEPPQVGVAEDVTGNEKVPILAAEGDIGESLGSFSRRVGVGQCDRTVGCRVPQVDRVVGAA